MRGQIRLRSTAAAATPAAVAVGRRGRGGGGGGPGAPVGQGPARCQGCCQRAPTDVAGWDRRFDCCEARTSAGARGETGSPPASQPGEMERDLVADGRDPGNRGGRCVARAQRRRRLP